MALNLTDRIGSVRAEQARASVGSFAAAFEALKDKSSRSGEPIDVAREYELAGRYGVRILTMVDDGYPEMLRNAPGRPLVLYVKGEVSALSKRGVAVVGTRRATAYGLSQAERFGCELAAEGLCVYSGLALGIDGAAHRGALAGGGTTVGVLGGALDCFYPDRNRELAREMIEKGGAVVSQFPFGRAPDQQSFPIRNHVVAALAEATLAVETPVKGGTLITCSIAADLGRTVMALPGRVDAPMSAGCLNLLRDGATLVRNARDVAEALGIRREVAAAPRDGSVPAGSVEESLVMGAVADGALSMDELARRTELSAAKVNSVCMMLRLKGRLRFLPGNRVGPID